MLTHRTQDRARDGSLLEGEMEDGHARAGGLGIYLGGASLFADKLGGKRWYAKLGPARKDEAELEADPSSGSRAGDGA